MTVRVRLACTYVAAMLLTLALVGTLVWWQMGAALRSALDQTLETRAAAVLSAIENNGQSGLQDGDVGGSSGVFVAIFDRSGRIVDASTGAPHGLRPPPPDAHASETILGSATYALHTVAGGPDLIVVAGSSLASITATLDGLARVLAVVGGLAVGAALAGGWWIAGRALRPVALITDQARLINAAHIDRRLPVPFRHDELQELATTLNGMLDRVAQALHSQGRFVAAASHDLRTPIAALQAELELAQHPETTAVELRAAVRAAHADAVRLGDLASGLLDLAAADADGRRLVRVAVRMDLLLESVARRASPVARQRDVEVTHRASSRVVRIDRVRIEQALTNLVVNAVTYGPRGAVVEVEARLEEQRLRGADQGPQLVIDVLDRGPGVPAEVVRSLFEPFHRGPNATATGSGLGLASAAAAVRAHHGTIGSEPRTGGGTRFWIRLPL